jgi:AraC-like DNA-binding protein
MGALFNKKNNRYNLNGDYGVHLLTTTLSCEEHTHQYIELVYCFSGCVQNFVDGEEYTLNKGDMLLIDKNSTHATYPKPRAKYCDIMLKPSFLDKSLSENEDLFSIFSLDEFSSFALKVQKEKRFIHFSLDESRKIEFLIKTTEEEQRQCKVASEYMRRSALCMLLTCIFRALSSEEGLNLNSDLLDYVREHCRENLTAGLLANRCYYTIEHFSRRFKKLAGKTFKEFLCECRLEYVAEKLLFSQTSVDEIFVDSGFTSRGEFFRKFEEKYGVTPAQYRKNQKSVQF